jgi:hypothetical protein
MKILQVTVFDFSTILERTERRVRDDLLGVGPMTVTELRSIAGRLRLKYQAELERRIARAVGHQDSTERDGLHGIPMTPAPLKDVLGKAGGAAGAMAGAAGALAGGFFSKVKTGAAAIGGINQIGRSPAAPPASTIPEPTPTIVDLPPLGKAVVPVAAATDGVLSEGDWTGIDMAPATDAISNFSIGDDEEDDFL